MRGAFFALATASALVANAMVEPSIGGRALFTNLKLTLSITAADPNWHTFGPGGGLSVGSDGVVRCAIENEKTPRIDCTFKGERQGEGARLAWTIRPTADVRLAMLGVTGTVGYRRLPGGWFEVDGNRIAFPKGAAQHIFNGEIRSLAICSTNGAKTVFAFAAPTRVYLQNNRPWGNEDFSIRLLVPSEQGVFKGGVTTTFDLTVTGAGAYDTEKKLEPHVLKAGPDWVPFATTPWIAPGTALDFSSIRRTEKPAGKYGSVVSRGGHFEFEKRPGERVRFYGINVCGDANTIPLEQARKFAANLARLGYNAIRFHHHESTLVRDMKDPTCCTLNPKAMEGFDALVAACVEHGIYMTTDLFVSRHNAGLTWRAIGIDRDGRLDMDDAKRLIPVNAKMFENYLTFTRRFLGHVNKYTGRTLAEEPALMGLSFVNEGNLDKYGGSYAQYPDWQNAYAAWLAKKRAEDPKTFAQAPNKIPGEIRHGKGTAFLLFLKETEADFARKVQKVLREELKCKALTTNMNDGWGNSVALQEVRERNYGYVDTHFYVDHPRFLGKSWRLPSQCPNANPILGEGMGAQQIAAVRVFGSPFTITEYNFSGPGRFRGVGGIACGTQAALQDWSGLWRFAWSHGRAGVITPERKIMGYFDISGDPLSLAAERASICLFLRGDLDPLKRTYATVIPPKSASSLTEAGGNLRTLWCGWASWYAKIGTKMGERLDGESAGFVTDLLKKNSDQVRAELLPNATAEKMPVAGDGHLRIDGEKGTFLLDTPRTSGGFAEGGRIDCGALRADLGKTAATLWASSLTDEPIARSKRLLVTYLTDVQNTDIRYADSNLTVLLDWGRLPHLMRNGEAEVSLAVAPGAWKVWVLSSDGSRRQEVPSSIEGGRLVFKVDVDRDPRSASFLYEAVLGD